MPALADVPTVPLSFSNNFWGRDDAGVDPLLTRMVNAKTTCDELRSFYKARAELEEDYSRKLFQLCRKPLGSTETGTLRASLDVTRGETEAMGKQHALIAQQMKSELEEPLTAFAGALKERRKIVQAGIERLHKTKQGQTATVNRARDKYEQDCLRIKGYLAQGHMVMGQEERKNKAKLEKTQINMASNSQEYEAAVKVLEETTGRWNKEWKAACDKFQDLEEERLDFTKSSLWAFANIASTVCVTDDASCEKVRLALEQCEVEKDIANFIRAYGTGQEIPDPPRYINFCRGDIDSASEVSDDENYSVAQFSRTTKPEFRTSSPVHTAPEPAHSQRMSEEPVEEIDVSTPKGANSGRPAPLNYKQAGPNVPPNYDPSEHGDVAHVPHNEYPTDGMTMFCRAGPPSTVGSALSSNTRPPSRDDVSEYSNPSSYTSAEPTSGKTSPIKNPSVGGVPLPGMTSNISMNPESSDKTVQKKRSGFFSNSPFNSPFRRKSKKELNNPLSNNESGQPRGSWNASSTRINLNPSNVSSNSASSSPVKAGVRQSPFNRNAGRMAPDGEEPADPRATFQLNIGDNVLDVNNPDHQQQSTNTVPRAGNNTSMAVSRRGMPLATPTSSDEHDPIARALADLKQSSLRGSSNNDPSMQKQASTRQPVDNYHRVKTPAPDQQPSIRPGSNQDVHAAQRGTPPPAYEGGASHRRAETALGVPQPAFTSKEMRSRTENWGMNGSTVSAPGGRPGSSMGRPGSSMGMQRPGSSMGIARPASRDGRRSPNPGMPRAISPQPQFNQNRARSPAPGMRSSPAAQGPPPQAYRSSSPNPYGGSVGRARGSTMNTGQRQPPSQSQPPNAGSGMEMQLARYADDQGSSRSRQGAPAPRPASSYGGDRYAQPPRQNPPPSQAQPDYESGGSGRGRNMDPAMRRERSKSVANVGYTGYAGKTASQSQQQQNQVQLAPAPNAPPGRTAPLHYARAMYSYTAAIPEELSFAKGDILAVMRMQDDGWWEAMVSRSVKTGSVGVGGVGLVPSNYLQRC